MNKPLNATFVLIILFFITSQASAQVAAFNSLSLHFSNTILTTAQYRQVLEGPMSGSQVAEAEDAFTKQHLGMLPATGHLFGDNTESKQMDILAEPSEKAEPMSVALEKWVNKELILQQPKRRGNH